MASRGFLAGCRIFIAVGLPLVVLSVAVHARAGDGAYSGIAAASLDGKFAAMFFVSYGSECEPGALVKTAGESQSPWGLERIVEVTTCTGWQRIPAFLRWKWSRKPAEARALHAFADLYDDKSAGKRARVAYAEDTGLFRVEILDGDRWWPVKTLAGVPPKLTGTLHVQGRYLRTTIVRSSSPTIQPSRYSRESRRNEAWRRQRSDWTASYLGVNTESTAPPLPKLAN